MKVNNDIFKNVLTNRDDLLMDCLKSGTDPNQHDASGRTALHYAAYMGSISCIEHLLKNGAKCDARDKEGCTALHKAAAKDRIKVVHKLLSSGCKVNPKCKISQTPLHSCAINCSLESAKALLDKSKTLIDKVDATGTTALLHASFYGHLPIVELLLVNGANFMLPDRDGLTAAHWACIGRRTQVFELLLKNGADITSVDVEKKTPLHFASIFSATDIAWIICDQADYPIDAPDMKGFTALHYACADNNLELVRKLISSGANLVASAHDGTTPLHVAVKFPEKTTIMEYLINKLPEEHVNDITKDGFTALHFACLSPNAKKATRLIETGARVDAQCWDGSTPLHYACLNGFDKIIEILINAKCDVDAKMTNGLTPLHVASMKGTVEQVKMLLKSGAKVNSEEVNGLTPLMLACKSRERGKSVIQTLLKCKANVNAKSRNGWTALHFAVFCGNNEVVECLLNAGADVEAGDNKNRTPLHFAVWNETGKSNTLIVKAICERKPELFLQFDSSHFLPIHYAAVAGNADCCIYFLELMYSRKQEYAVYDRASFSPMHLACLHNCPNVVEALLNWENSRDLRRSFVQYTDVNYRIPLHYAMKEGHISCVKLLLKYQPKLQLNWGDKTDSTPLHLAAASDKSECLGYSLKFISDIFVNFQDNNRRTSGMIALTSCKSPPSAFIELSNKRLVDKNGRGYLHRAAAGKSFECFDLLLSEWHDLNVRDYLDVTPLHIAVGFGNKEFVMRLISAGAKLNVLDIRGLSPADWAAAHGHTSLLENLLNPQKLKKYIEQDITEQSPMSNKALILASTGGHVECVSYLLKYDPSLLTSRDHSDRTALHWAAANGHYEVVELLIDEGAELDAIDKYERTPLMLSVAKSDYMHVSDLLIHKGCSVTMKDMDGNTALHLAIMNSNEEAGKIIFDKISTLEDRDAVNLVNNNGETFVHCATQYGLPDLLSNIIPYCIPSLFAKDKRGRLPICSVVDNENVVECLTMVFLACIPDSQDSKSYLSPRNSSFTADPENDTF